MYPYDKNRLAAVDSAVNHLIACLCVDFALSAAESIRDESCLMSKDTGVKVGMEYAANLLETRAKEMFDALPKL